MGYNDIHALLHRNVLLVLPMNDLSVLADLKLRGEVQTTGLQLP